MNHIDITRILLIVAGIGGLATDQIFQTNINHLFGVHGGAVIEALSAVAAIASTILHTVANPTPATPAPPVAPTPAPPTVAYTTTQYQLPTSKG